MGSIKHDITESCLGIYETALEKWDDLTQFLVETWPLLLILFLGLLGVWWYADPPPPRQVLIATGQPGGSYEILGKKYAAFFEKKGITLELLATEGAEENIAHLVDRKDPVQAAFVQAGAFNSHDVKGVESLGAIAYAPIWFFYRGPELKDTDFQSIKVASQFFLNSRISVGQKGSGSYAQAMHMLKANGFEEGRNFVHLPGLKAAEALQKGEIEGAFIVDDYEAPVVQKLLADPNLRIAAYPRAEALIRSMPFLQILNVPMGSFSLTRNFPSTDIKLMASTTNLLIDDRMHPALQFLFLEAAREINGKASFFAEYGEFPSFKNIGLPESPVALHYEKNGSPLLMLYFPFWLAELINRLVFVFLPFCAVAYPVLLMLPGYRNKRMQRKIDLLYITLKTYEQELTENFSPEVKDEYLKKLDLLEYEALKLQVPKSLTGSYYSLRTSIDYVRNCLNRGIHPYQIASADIILQ
ncbi:TAXI family TRAP transporter solute-binding subunit [Polynucleobacter sp. CS-Odin-A6]|uniref:TAXI family TRAP transporter solute-binding subunit n=1 Tax=Polynucleobacter sp. CS-Odin-A6 TaxID=2689106 RepID=UPI001C0BEA51|nr:TAXI family TRAP transporter solute-binding subunit [Polynucleobacter sp. CS-Odin-A6]MBU3621768.1 TRAP transporter substrate-binding protein [Polynucleobacter sp. CS-Odin-A6]